LLSRNKKINGDGFFDEYKPTLDGCAFAQILIEAIDGNCKKS
jgi:hypothetical protein